MPAGVGREARALCQDHLVVDDVHRDVQDRRLAGPPPLGPADGDVEQLLALDHAGHGLGAHGAADDVVDVGRRHAPLLALLRIDAELQVRRPADVEDAHVGDALDVLQDVLGLGGQQLQLVEVRAEDLERIVALDPGQSLQHVVADVLRKVPGDARNAPLQVGVHRVDDFAFRPRARRAPDPPPPAGLPASAWASLSGAAAARSTRRCNSPRCPCRRRAGRSGSRSTRPRGSLAMMARACLAIATWWSRFMFSGPMPRSHRFPSSSSGMNSRPSCGIKQAVPPIKNAISDTGDLGDT